MIVAVGNTLKNNNKTPWNWSWDTYVKMFDWSHSLISGNDGKHQSWKTNLNIIFSLLSKKHTAHSIKYAHTFVVHCCAWIILCICPANQRRHYSVTPSFIGWVHTQIMWKNHVTYRPIFSGQVYFFSDSAIPWCFSNVRTNFIHQWPYPMWYSILVINKSKI